jgi:hypothetical protein
MDGWTRWASLVLRLACGGLSLSQIGCTSQTAIVIVTRDAGGPTGDSFSARPEIALPDAQPQLDLLAGADALSLLDVIAGADTPSLLDVVSASDSMRLSDVPAPSDTLVPPETPPDAMLADAHGHETMPEVASTRDTLPAGPVTLFSDGFSGGYEVNWLLSDPSDGPVTDTRDGTNAIVTLDASQDDYTRIQCNLSGDKFTAQDLTASMRLRIEQAPSSTRTVRLDVRQSATTANIFYAVGVVVASDGTITNVSIFKKVPDLVGNYTICELATGPMFATPIAMNQWRRIKLTISGTSSVRLVAFFEDLQVATFTDDCTSPLTATNGVSVANAGCLADQTGLGIQVEKGLKASVDDVLVTGP